MPLRPPDLIRVNAAWAPVPEKSGIARDLPVDTQRYVRGILSALIALAALVMPWADGAAQSIAERHP